MMEWTSLELGRALQHLFDHRGRTPKKLGSEFTSAGVQVISAKLVSGGRLNLDRERRFVTPDTYERWMPVKLAEGDVLLTSEAPLGEAALVPSSISLCLGQRLFALRADPGVLDNRFLYYWLRSPVGRAALAERSSGTTVLGIRQAELVQVVIRAPDVRLQRAIGELLASLDELIENNRRRVEVLEDMVRALYREWFIRFRYPGHEDIPLVDSVLGPIPNGWAVKRVRELGATGAGPFGSKLGRKDYVADGVPVLRGTNLRVGGGFVESDFVFVTPEKAEELRSSTTLRGDIVITQRGTLGQIALIPETSAYERYVLSQSQMKLTVNTDAASPEFVYRQMSTAEVTARFIAQAMSSGVPHVNLTLLREFEIVAPPSDLQHRFGDLVRGLDQEASALRAQARTLGAVRDLLLPKLVTGQIDVSHLDLDALTEAASA